MDWVEYKKWGEKAIQWGFEYRKKIREFPVRSQVKPGDIFNSLPEKPPEDPEPIEQIFQDFKTKLIPGITHWQHPRFFAYFPSNASAASVFAEMLANTMGAQCMLWQTSPAGTELEEKIIDWLRIYDARSKSVNKTHKYLENYLLDLLLKFPSFLSKSLVFSEFEFF